MGLDYWALHNWLLTLTVILAGLYAMLPYFRKNSFPLEGRTAIVTGGSQGLGLSIAKLLAQKGANVVIVAQDQVKLTKALQEISGCASSPKQRFSSLSFDLRSAASAPQILSTVTDWNHDSPPDVLFCCAGNCLPGFFASSSVEQLRSQMETIYWSAAYMAHATLNSWLKPSATPAPPRHLIFTSSTLAFFPVAGYAPYTPAKAAMRALADTLNQEVAVYNGTRLQQQSMSSPPADINIHTVFPMGILTPGYENENLSKPKLTVQLEKDDKPQSPDEVAKIVIARLEAGDNMITTMLLGHILKGVSMGPSVRNGLIDLLWTFIGSIAILFVTPDFISKCRKWGKEKGIESAK